MIEKIDECVTALQHLVFLTPPFDSIAESSASRAAKNQTPGGTLTATQTTNTDVGRSTTDGAMVW